MIAKLRRPFEHIFCLADSFAYVDSLVPTLVTAACVHGHVDDDSERAFVQGKRLAIKFLLFFFVSFA